MRADILRVALMLFEGGLYIDISKRLQVPLRKTILPDAMFIFAHEQNKISSGFDQETEDQILDTIFEMRGKITIIILSHNPDVIERCDVVYSLQQQ